MSLFKRYRGTLERHYVARADVLEERLVENPLNGLSRPKWVTVLTGVPCRISHLSGDVSGADPLPEAGQRVKLFVAPDVEIRPGSRVQVLDDGGGTVYRYAGHAASYDSDQEIVLERLEGTEL